MLVTTTWFGTFLIDAETGTVIKKKLFPKTVPKLIERLNTIQNAQILVEEEQLVKGVTGPLTVTDKRLQGLGAEVVAVEQLPEGITLLPEDFGFKPELYHKAILELAKTRTRTGMQEDQYMIQAVKGLDDLTQISNLLSERLHEWYGIYWPELENLVGETEYVNMVAEHGDIATILERSENKKLQEFNAADTIGMKIGPEDREAVMGYGRELKNVHAVKTKLERYISGRMGEIAPNLTSLIGPIIGARLMALTNGLERLAKVSSSTIQLLGAEKALFRHLRDGELPPKHGIIFQHPLIHNAPYWQRGKIARAFAGKIAIAAKLDYNSGKFMGPALEQDIKRRIDEIKKRYPIAPARGSKKRGRKERKGKFDRDRVIKKGKKGRTRRGKRGKKARR